MNRFLIKFRYQGDDRCEDTYSAYSNKSEEEVEDAVYSLPNFDILEQFCIENYQEPLEEDEEYEQFASVYVEDITNDPDIADSDWFKSLDVLIDER